MKKVRFESPSEYFTTVHMEDSDPQYPRPCLGLAKSEVTAAASSDKLYQKVLQMKSNPVTRFENSDSVPYPGLQLTNQCAQGAKFSILPTTDLELSMLDTGWQEPRKQNIFKCIPPYNPPVMNALENNSSCYTNKTDRKVLEPMENVKVNYPPNVLNRDKGFFIRRNVNVPLDVSSKNFPKINVKDDEKENNPFFKKHEIMYSNFPNPVSNLVDDTNYRKPERMSVSKQNECHCQYCSLKLKDQLEHCVSKKCHYAESISSHDLETALKQCPCASVYCERRTCIPKPICYCHGCPKRASAESKPLNSVEEKTWAIEKYEKNITQNKYTDLEKPSSVVKEKREPTVADLFKIIKLQNQQLQLLQEKVDNFITASNNKFHDNSVSHQPALDADDKDLNKISIGVMTSFEMFCTSTILNKEVVTQTKNQNTQIQCNRSQISIKGVAIRQPVNENFLDGISPIEKNKALLDTNELKNEKENQMLKTPMTCDENAFDEKVIDELSLYDVQVNNATTPMISPEQTMYLDVRDYSESDSGSDDQSNIGWTYYNKVMTHVNGMLHDSDMPSSASALYRNTRQQCVQMKVDKTNVSVMKRVKFGDHPEKLPTSPIKQVMLTDTSMKMNQLAAKYLNGQTSSLPKQGIPTNPEAPEMSFATRNYMERHQILQHGSQQVNLRSPTLEMPRFLDITALKQQPKFL